VQDADGSAVAGLSVEVAATMPAMGMALPAQPATAQMGATGYGCALLFGMAGMWRVDVRFTAPGGSPRPATFQVVVR
jgi:hypothetical protein